MTTQEMQIDALDRARNGQSAGNYAAIFSGLMEKGIAETEIKPRENVFTYQAWLAQGRHVRKGEHGVRVSVFVKTEKVDADTGETRFSSFPKGTTVFHITQTDLNK